jgi:hypothetical protein
VPIILDECNLVALTRFRLENEQATTWQLHPGLPEKNRLHRQGCGGERRLTAVNRS